VQRGLSYQAFWLLAARLLGFSFLFLLPLTLVRVLSQSDFGIYKQAFQLVMTGQAILTFGFGLSAFYYLGREPERAPQIVWNIFLYHALAGTIGGVVLVLWPGLLDVISGSGHLSDFAVPVALLLLTYTVGGFMDVIATARGDVFWSTIFIVGSQFSRSLFLISAALIFRDVYTLLLAGVIHGVIQMTALLWYILRTYPGCWRRFDWSTAKEQISYTVPQGASGLLYVIQSDLHWLLVANRVNAADFAIYSVGTTQLPLVGMLRDAVSSVILPRVSKLQREGRDADVLQLMLAGARKLALLYIPLFFCLLVTGRDFILTLFRKDYLASWPIFAINLLLLPMGILLTDAVTRAYAEHRVHLLKFRIVLCVFQLAVSWAFIRNMGMIGAVVALVLVNVVERVYIVWFVGRLLSFSQDDKRWAVLTIGRISAAALAAACGAAASQYLMTGLLPAVRLALASGVFGVLYLGMSLLMNNLTLDEKEIVNRYSDRYLRFRPFPVSAV
jgi:O-antigen/teichoic acid export membrane protein